MKIHGKRVKISYILLAKFFATFSYVVLPSFYNFDSNLGLKAILYLLLEPVNFCRKAIHHKYCRSTACASTLNLKSNLYKSSSKAAGICDKSRKTSIIKKISI